MRAHARDDDAAWAPSTNRGSSPEFRAFSPPFTWGHWPGPRKLVYAGLWNVFLPAVTQTLGRFPAFFLGGGEDLPREVALDWARWCRNPNYFGQDTGHPAFAAPILSLSFSDDPYAPLPAVKALLDRYGSPSKEIRHLEPAKVKLPSIGHFGFFRPKAARLWQDVATWLEIRLEKR